MNLCEKSISTNRILSAIMTVYDMHENRACSMHTKDEQENCAKRENCFKTKERNFRKRNLLTGEETDMSHYLAVDLGTTGCRSILFDAELNLIADSYREYALETPKEKWAQQDANLWWSLTLETAKEAIAKSKEMMDGHKADLFMLHLTFIGWDILAALTLNIGYIWLNPYKNAADAAFYRKLKLQNMYQS